MRTVTHPLTPATPGTQRTLTSLHYGTPGAGPKAYVQASLHADEVPGMLVAHHLRARLATLEAAGLLRGEVVLVPAANPPGLSQVVLQGAVGRFHLASGENFNRHYPDLLDSVAPRLAGRLRGEPVHDTACVREALRTACDELGADTELDSLRKTLLGLAIDADTVLDLHCDYEAVLHLYTATPLWPQTEGLARALGAELTLLALESGDDPFDEACSMIWPRLAQRLGVDLPAACLAVTVELRGENDVDHAWAAQDAEGLLRFLALRGVIDEPAGAPLLPLPPLRGEPRPLAGSWPLTTPQGGVLVFLREPGAHVARGDVIVEVIDPIAGTVLPLASPIDGLLYARVSRRYAQAGTRVAKIAGTDSLRSGKLLSA